MTVIEGLLFSPRSSRAQAVVVRVDQDGRVIVATEDGDVLFEFTWREIEVSDRIGRTPRRLTFPDGHVLETGDNDAIDALEKAFRGTTAASLFHRMEKLTWVTLIAVVVAGAISGGFFFWGLPAASDQIARALPQNILATTGNQTLAFLDRTHFDASTLPADRQAALVEIYAGIVSASGFDPDNTRLEFRSAPALGPNALALPNGTVILTDEIVRLARTDEQLQGVLAHEFAHVEQRHLVRSFLRSTATAVIVVMITGDMAELTEFAIGIGAFALQMRYSRSFETEADMRAVGLMQALGQDPKHLADLFRLLKAEVCHDTCEQSWLSSHPDIDRRIERIETEAVR